MKIRLMFLSVFFMFAFATLAFSSFGVGQAHAAASVAPARRGLCYC